MMFGDRDGWFNHELHHHHSLNICNICGYQCTATTFLKQHIVDQHGPYPNEELASMLKHGRIAPSHLKAQDCPFCDDWALTLSRRRHQAEGRPSSSHHQSDILVSLTHFKRHVAMHQEQLAIFTVPREVDSDDGRSHGTDEKGLSVISSDHSNPKSVADEEALSIHSDAFATPCVMEQRDRMKINDRPLSEILAEIRLGTTARTQAVEAGDLLERMARTERTEKMQAIYDRLDGMDLEEMEAEVQTFTQAINDAGDLDRESKFQFFPLCSSFYCGRAQHPGRPSMWNTPYRTFFRGMPLWVSSCVPILLHGCWRPSGTQRRVSRLQSHASLSRKL